MMCRCNSCSVMYRSALISPTTWSLRRPLFCFFSLVSSDRSMLVRTTRYFNAFQSHSHLIWVTFLQPRGSIEFLFSRTRENRGLCHCHEMSWGEVECSKTLWRGTGLADLQLLIRAVAPLYAKARRACLSNVLIPLPGWMKKLFQQRMKCWSLEESGD